MRNISDIIEQFLVETLGEDDAVQISRNELANFFSCAPSQINYVLSTRFTPERGYIIESRRGGGGGVTVIRIRQKPQEAYSNIIEGDLADGISETKAKQVVTTLYEAGAVTKREEEFIKTAISDKTLIAPSVVKDKLRGNILKNILITLLKLDGCGDDAKELDGSQGKEK